MLLIFLRLVLSVVIWIATVVTHWNIRHSNSHSLWSKSTKVCVYIAVWWLYLSNWLLLFVLPTMKQLNLLKWE